MKRLIWTLGITLTVFSLLGVASVHSLTSTPLSSQNLASGAKLEPSACWFDVPAALNVQCAWMATAPLPGQEISAFRLPVVIMKYQGADRKPDPLLYLAGGPGASAMLDKHNLENYWFKWFQSKAGMKRDLILFDQRGSGLSQPSVYCDDFRSLRAQVLSKPGTPVENARLYRNTTQQCYNSLQQQGVALEQLGTQYSAQDVYHLMQLLGHEQWNLLGVSYGTRLAFEVQSRYPQHVRSMSLDSVYPPNMHLLREWPDLLGNSLQRVFDFCASDSQCALENGDVKARFHSLMQQLRTQPLNVPVAGLHLGGLQQLQLNDEILLAMLFDSQYASASLGKLANMLRYLQEGKLQQVMPQIETYLYHQFDDSFHEAVFWAVECRDNPPIPDNDLEQRLSNLPELRYYLPTDYDVCDIWRNKAGDQVLVHNLQHPARQTPALILAGKDDPITPVSWAVDAAVHEFAKSKAYLFSFANISHSVLDNKHCANELLIGFLNEPNERPSADCRFEPEDFRVAAAAN